MTTRDLLREIDAFIAETGISSSRLGRMCVNDTSFVGEMRAGLREPRARTVDKVRDFMRDYRKMRCQLKNRTASAFRKPPRRNHYAHRAVKVDPTPDQYVDRDPCFRCGARGDFDCGHRGR